MEQKIEIISAALFAILMGTAGLFFCVSVIFDEFSFFLLFLAIFMVVASVLIMHDVIIVSKEYRKGKE